MPLEQNQKNMVEGTVGHFFDHLVIEKHQDGSEVAPTLAERLTNEVYSAYP